MLKEQQQEQNYYETDDPAILYNLICQTEEAVFAASASYSHRQEVEALCESDYQTRKSRLLLAMRREESRNPAKKRTDAVREAVYRVKLKDVRLMRDLAKGQKWSAKEHLDSLRAVLESRRDRLRFLGYERAGIKQGA